MKRILIIEDDPIIGHIYRTRLEKEGYEVEVAADGQSGFYRIHEFRPDGVLLDLMLPKLNGVEILKKIRAQAQFQKVPIIVFTNAYVPNMIQESFAAGATQVFNKATLTPRQIIDAINNALSLTAPALAGATPPTPIAQNTAGGTAGEASLDAPTTFGDAPFHSGSDGSGTKSTSGTTPPFRAAGDTAGVPNAPASAATAATPVNTTEAQRADDAAFQADLLQTFMDTAPEILGGVRKALQDFSKAQDETSRLPHVLELYRKVHAITGSAGIAGLRHISQMAAALEVLLKELYEKPKNINASTLRTVAHSIDFIGELFQKGLDPDWADTAPVNILVVDDEILSRRAITYALEKAGLKSVAVEDPQVALNLATETAFHLIFLDVQMPGMDGFDLCTKIRALPNNKTTPVIFVTSLTDFKSRARSSLSGGTDLIAKPFMFIELSVKALTYVMRAQLAKRADERRAA
jgi:DNA-binding response OmpR family regulator